MPTLTVKLVTMMESSVPLELLRRIDAACDRFEQAWRQGTSPRTESYLGEFAAGDHPALLQALQSLQSELILNQLADSRATPPQTKELPQYEGDAGATILTPQVDILHDSAPSDQQGDQGSQVIFRVVEGPHQGLEFQFRQHDTLLAGRLQKAQLRLENDPHFSRHHFRLEINPPECFLLDLNSRNGTYVNGERVREKLLRDGDVISGGKTKMIVTVLNPKDPMQRKPTTESGKTTSASRVGTDSPANQVTDPSGTDAAGMNLGEPSFSIAGYRLHEQIGTGDLGAVFRATRLSTGQISALKILSPAAHRDENSIQRFLREASVLNQLDHPNIVRFLDMGTSRDEIYVATEFVNAISWSVLAKRLSREKRVRFACALIAQVLSALEYAHARSFVHRDVKPGNILIERKQNSLTAKLADFGLAKHYTTAGMSQMTRDGEVLGSLPFMSPDQFLNSREVRPASDIYSVGATLYWMLTGQPPIPFENHPCKFLAILEAPPTPIRDVNPAVPESLALIVHRALEKDADARFTSVAEMKFQLRHFK